VVVKVVVVTVVKTKYTLSLDSSWERNFDDGFSPHCMEPERSLPCLQQPTTCPYPEPDQSSPCPHIPLTGDPS
jgi:hypothetical protein